MIEIICEQCGKKYNYSRSTRKGASRKHCNSCCVSNRRRKVKLKAIEYKGGSCIICGYNKCVAALDFHHLIPEEKEFSISVSGNTRKWELVKKELDKCILVCSNCHREIESGFTIVPCSLMVKHSAVNR